MCRSLPRPLWELKAIIMERYAEVKRKVSSLATSGGTALAMLALIPTDVTWRCSAYAFPFYSGVIYNECGRKDKPGFLYLLHYKQLIIMSVQYRKQVKQICSCCQKYQII